MNLIATAELNMHHLMHTAIGFMHIHTYITAIGAIDVFCVNKINIKHWSCCMMHELYYRLALIMSTGIIGIPKHLNLNLTTVQAAVADLSMQGLSPVCNYYVIITVIIITVI